MFWFNMGPRGRKFGHRGFRPEIFVGLLGLFFGGWIIIAVLGGLLGAGIMVLGSVFSILPRIVSRIVPALLSSKGFAVGLVIGLIWALRNRKRNAISAEEAETIDTGTKEETEEAIVETKNYRFYA